MRIQDSGFRIQVKAATRGPTTAHWSLVTGHFVVAALLAATMSGCGTTAKREPRAERPSTVSKAPPSVPAPRGGGYYLDDGPGENPPADLDSIPEPTPKFEPLHRGASRPYVVMGRSYTPMTTLAPYKARGIATWYGRRYHGKMTSSGEIYDMYGMTAAHPILPVPSYARVTSLRNGKSVVVRINDRGPFVEDRVIDLSYTAARRLGILAGGSALVEVESIIPGAPEPALVAAAPPRATPQSDSAAPATPREAHPPATPPPAVEPQPPMSAASAPQVPVTTDASGVYLQLGAFGSRENAENFLARLKAQLDWLALNIIPRDGLFRVHAGPYANQAEARQIADRISQALGVRPFVLTR